MTDGNSPREEAAFVLTPKGRRFIELVVHGFDEEEASLITWSEFEDDGISPRRQN